MNAKNESVLPATPRISRRRCDRLEDLRQAVRGDRLLTGHRRVSASFQRKDKE
jgi:hypothetical protein